MRSLITSALMLFFIFSTNSYAHDTSKCAQVESALERLDCYDGQAKLQSSQPTPSQALTNELLVKPSVPVVQLEVAKLAGTKPSFFSRPVGTAAEYSGIITEIKKSQQKVHVALDNGQIWQIQKSHLVSFKVGEKAHIKQGMIGGFIMRVKGGGSYRVKQMH